MKILVVEDDVSLREGLVELLIKAEHEVQSAKTGREALELCKKESFELVLLDLMLPLVDGITVCKKLRKTQPELFILILTAKGLEEDKILGLSEGADDYVTKPFSSRELLARVQVFERRSKMVVAEPEVVVHEAYAFDFSRLQVVKGGESIPLTPMEVAALRWLYRHRQRVVTREEFLEHVWRVSPKTVTRAVDATLIALRKKLGIDTTDSKFLVTVAGVGYIWEV